MQAKKHFLFYGNASSHTGSGHIMRLLAIAQVCAAQSISLTFLCTQCPQPLQQRLMSEGFPVKIINANFRLSDILQFEPQAIFIDDYAITETQWEVFKRANTLLVNLDDNIDDSTLISDVIINPAPNANEEAYKARAPQAVFCLGPAYTYLRQEFAQQPYIDIENRKQILITLGGADVKNMAFCLAQALLSKLANVEVCLLIGALNTSAQAKLTTLQNHYPNLTIIHQSQQVASLMMASGLAISAAGGTLGELASMGVPTIALVSADNQEPALTSPLVNTWYQAHDVRRFNASTNVTSLSVPDRLLLESIVCQADELWRDLCKRRFMSEHARQIIDSHGCERIVQTVLEQLEKRKSNSSM